MPTQFGEYEQHARQLEQIAETLDKKSRQYAALERAGWALAFATMHHHSEFQQFLRNHTGEELSLEQKAELKKFGPT